LATKVTRLTEKLTKLKDEMGKLAVYEEQMLASPDQQISLTDPDSRSMAIDTTAPHGRLKPTVLGGLADFARELTANRKS
jgi:DNA invertase Pin-like site-specific DNA recombinase